MMNNPFALFDLPVAFNVDQKTLSERYLALQKALHPDNFAHGSAQEQRVAMQKSAEVNDAFQVLKDPILRAESIIALKSGESQDNEQRSSQDMTFLMQQMQWRERLEDIEQAKDLDALLVFSDEISQSFQEKTSEIARVISAQNWEDARLACDRLRFIKKLMAEIERIEETLTDF